MSDLAGLATELRTVWWGDEEGEAYHGPALAPVLAGIPASATGTRVPGARSIAEILLHVAAWRDYVIARMAGGSVEAPEAEGWAAAGTLGEPEWVALRARLRAQEDALLACVQRTTPPLPARAPDLLRFVLHHDLHHGGQVAMLASAARAGR